MEVSESKKALLLWRKLFVLTEISNANVFFFFFFFQVLPTAAGTTSGTKAVFQPTHSFQRAHCVGAVAVLTQKVLAKIKLWGHCELSCCNAMC